jgi:hypothetical protein
MVYSTRKKKCKVFVGMFDTPFKPMKYQEILFDFDDKSVNPFETPFKPMKYQDVLFEF